MQKAVHHMHIIWQISCWCFIYLHIQLTEIDQLIATSGNIFQQQVVSKAREEYQALYRDEIELNETFDQFVHNFKAAYEGRNTRKDQVIEMAVFAKLSHPESCKS